MVNGKKEKGNRNQELGKMKEKTPVEHPVREPQRNRKEKGIARGKPGSTGPR